MGFLWEFMSKGDHLMETTYLKATNMETVIPSGCPISPQTLERIRTGGLGDLSVPRAHVALLYPETDHVETQCHEPPYSVG